MRERARARARAYQYSRTLALVSPASTAVEPRCSTLATHATALQQTCGLTSQKNRLQQLSYALARGRHTGNDGIIKVAGGGNLHWGLLPADLLVVDYSKIDVCPRRIHPRACGRQEGRGNDGDTPVFPIAYHLAPRL